MLSIFSFVSALWVLAIILRWSLRDRLPKRLQARWVPIVGGVSAFVLAEGEFATGLGPNFHLAYFVVLAASCVLARWMVPRLREHIANLAILLVLLIPAVSFIYLRSSLNLVIYYLLAAITGVLLYLSFRDHRGFDLGIGVHFTAQDEFDSTESR